MTGTGSPAERLLSLPNWQIRLVGPEEMLGALARVLAPIGAGEPLPALAVQISPDGHAASGTVNGRSLWSVALPERGWLAVLLGHVGATAVALLRRLLYVHAAAVAVGGRGWIVVGGTGTGKTSLAALLVRAGADYLSDEIAVLDPAAGTAVPLALPLTVKPWTARAIGPLPEGVEVASESGIRFYSPAARAPGVVPVEAFVLLEKGRRAALVPAARAEILMALAHHPSSLREAHRLEDAFAGFAALIRQARCYTLTAAAPSAAARLLASAAGAR